MRRLFLALALLLLFGGAGVLVYQAARARDYRSLMTQGDAALAADQTFGAIEAYSGAVALRPDSTLAHLRRAETYQRRGDLEAAARDFRTAAELDPTSPRPLDELGDVLYSLQRYTRAAEIYEAYLRLDDRSAQVDYKLALARYRAGDVAAAIDALRRAVAVDGHLADAYYLLGLCLRDSDRPADAVKQLQRAVALAPGLVAAREELADLYGTLDRRSDQLEQLQIIASLDRGHVERQIAVGLAYARAGDPDLAVRTLGRALQKTPGQPQIYEALGRVWLDIAQARHDRVALGKALEALGRVASNPAASSEALELVGQALQLDGQTDAAERTLQQAASREPVASSALLAYANAAEHDAHLDAARVALMQYRALEPDGSSDLHIAARLGTLSARLHDDRTAVGWFEQAVDLSPHDPSLLAALAGAQFRLGWRADAKATTERGLAEDPKNTALAALARRLR
jgi:tetratricopeptide (TPR) repeat protein